MTKPQTAPSTHGIGCKSMNFNGGYGFWTCFAQNAAAARGYHFAAN